VTRLTSRSTCRCFETEGCPEAERIADLADRSLFPGDEFEDVCQVRGTAVP
jgi:hypothetical protein